MLSLLLSLADVAETAAQAVADSTVATVIDAKSSIESLMTPENQNAVIKWVVGIVKNFVIAGIVFLIGKSLIKLAKKLVSKLMDSRNFDPSLSSFIKSLICVVLYFVLIIIIIDILGLETSSFVALFASAGVAIGMALSGTLQNFAGGVMILLFRPFKVGDYIAASGNEGFVKEIQIFNTIIKTADGKTVIIPNGGLSTNVLVNFSTEGIRRIQWTFGIAYGDDVDKAKQIIYDVLNANDKVLKDPACSVAISELNSSSVDFAAFGWVKVDDYWGVLFSVNEAVYKSFNEKGINIPFPQMDVHVIPSK